MNISNNDRINAELAVRILDSKTKNPVGSGILVSQDNLENNLYLVTAAHCLFEDKDKFQLIRKGITAEIYNPYVKKYVSFDLIPNENFLFKDINKDIGVIILDKSVLGFDIPQIELLKERQSFDVFSIKGFPQATKGKEIVTINPLWKQESIDQKIFNLELSEDYSSFSIDGFSGSGTFLVVKENIYLLGIFTRYRADEKGKVIYCQFIEVLDELLHKNYLPPLTYSYLGTNGLTHEFFKDNVDKSIAYLGERYNDELNFKLPIAHRFNELAKDSIFQKRILKVFDQWLTNRVAISHTDHKKVQNIEKTLLKLREKLVDWERNYPINVFDIIEFQWFLDELNELDKLVDNTIGELYDESYKISKKEKNKKIGDENIYRSDISRLKEISRNNYKLREDFRSAINLSLVNHPYLIIRGEAGSGKSHLLGDVANERLRKKLPTILLLGQLFNSSISLEKNIMEQLDLPYTFKDLLIGLESIGHQIQSRVLILIDAVNETTAGTKFWKEQILGLINTASKFPHIGIAFTIRDTYWDYLMPININSNAIIIEHEAFKGNEYKALKMFCHYYGLIQPNFPILSQEFANPLFLKLCCSGIKNSGGKVFPSGFNGINKVFNYYIDSVYTKISVKQEYKLLKHIVWDAVKVFSKECINLNNRQIKIRDAIKLFNDNFSNTPNLLIDLVEEGIFIKSFVQYYRNKDGKYMKEDTEVIYFAYEKLGDYLIADFQLQNFDNINDLKSAFNEDGVFGKRITDDDYNFKGILDAFAVILPEKFSIELYEIYQWVFDKYFIIENSPKNLKEKYQLKSLCEDINNICLKSLKWRTIDSINETKLLEYFQSKAFDLTFDYDYYLYTILQLSCIEGHPMNGDRLHHILISHKMGDRDAFWQQFISNYSDENYGNGELPIKRLLDFAWQPNISSEISDETCRLLGQTLAWVLSTTDTILRDKVTKALVNLFEQKPYILVEVLKAFKKVNDLYILERLYATAYGVVLRTNSDEGIGALAQYTFDNIFKRKNVTTHILLRDYARNIVEYALYKKLILKGDMELTRPPYTSEIPKLPSKKDIEKYNVHHTSEKYKKNPELSRLFGQTYFSTMEWDFGRYEVNSKLDDFYPISFTKEPSYKDFISGAKKIPKAILRLYSTIIKTILKFESNSYHLKKQFGEEDYAEQLRKIKDEPRVILSKAKELNIFGNDLEFVKNEILPYLEIKEKLSSTWGYTHTLNPEPFKRWIVERVHKLGYDVRKHADFDTSRTKFTGADYNSHVERISKKYQWIALYEILAILTDNYKMRTNGGSKPYDYFKGTWQNYLRDIDPGYITPDNTEKYDDDNEIVSEDEFRNWFDKKPYTYWDISPQEWVTKVDDLPKIHDIIIKKDNDGNEWLHLQKFLEYVEPKLFGEDKYDREKKDFWCFIQGYIVKKKDKAKLVEFLNVKNLKNVRLPENNSSSSTLINREKFWSPADKDETKYYNRREWEEIRDTEFKVIVATTGAKGTLEKDKSEANQKYNIPCKIIFEGLNLKYALRDGDFRDDSGKIIVTNSGPEGVMIRKDILLNFLKVKNLEILWFINVEKRAKLDKDTMGRYLFGNFSGLFFINQNLNLEGNLILTEKHKNY